MTMTENPRFDIAKFEFSEELVCVAIYRREKPETYGLMIQYVSSAGLSAPSYLSWLKFLVFSVKDSLR